MKNKEITFVRNLRKAFIQEKGNVDFQKLLKKELLTFFNGNQNDVDFWLNLFEEQEAYFEKHCDFRFKKDFGLESYLTDISFASRKSFEQLLKHFIKRISSYQEVNLTVWNNFLEDTRNENAFNIDFLKQFLVSFQERLLV